MDYTERMTAGHAAMLNALNYDGPKAGNFKKAEDHFEAAASEIPVANEKWAYATEMMLLARKMRTVYT